MKSKIIFLLICFCSLNSLGQKKKAFRDLFANLKTAKDTNRVVTLNEIARAYLADNQIDSVEYYANAAAELSDKIGWTKGIATGYANKGLVYYYYGNLEKATDFFLKALEIYEINGLSQKAIGTLSNLSNISSDLLKYEDAKKYIARALVLNAQYPDTIMRILLYSNAARNYNLLSQPHDVFKYVDSGMMLVKIQYANPALTSEDSLRISYNVHFLKLQSGIAYSKEGKYQEAINIFIPEWEIIKTQKGSRDKLELLEQLAENYNNLKLYNTALQYTLLGLEILRQDSTLDGYVDIYEKQSEAYAGLKKFEEAYNAHVLFKSLNDSFVNNKNMASIAAMQTKYETEKKDQQILQLNNEKKTQRTVLFLAMAIVIIALGLLVFALRSRKLQQRLFRQKEELISKEKEVEKKAMEQKIAELEQMALRAQMNPHFIFNSLNSVQHFVMNHDVEGVNKYLAAFAHLIRQTLNNSGKQLISIEEEIKYLDTYLSLERMKSGERFKYTINADENFDTSKTYIPGMILQPFVENSIKHGVAHKTNDDGFINIRISKNGKLVCRIEDNGIGRQKASEIKKATTSEYESKGMDITMHRIDAINKLYNTDVSVHVADLQDTAGNVLGTCVTVDLPPDLE